MEEQIRSWIAAMTLEEKAGLCSGLDFWRTKPVERLGIPSILMTDGPHGLRKQREGGGLMDSVPATCFPSGAALACSWDRELLQEVGKAIGEECQAEGVSILLGPAVNIKRSPLCGRNFEYFSEDPLLASELALSHIRGVQSQGVGTSIKHFAANNQEHRRLSVDAVVDERTLREIYLASFETAVRHGQPWTVMCAYNRVNGTYCAENVFLLRRVLREDWGFTGFVVSDWGAVDERVPALEAGLDLEMPGNGGVGDRKIVAAVQAGKLPESVLNEAVARILRVVLRAVANRKEGATYDVAVHHQLARRAARESMVLLKNEGDILPLRRGGTIAVIGAFARSPRYQGGGSSHVHPTRLDIPYEEIVKAAGPDARVLYAPGYSLDADDVDPALLDEARAVAAAADVAVVFAGLPERYESEGYDRPHMRMPENHVRLIEAVAEVQPRTVVVLANGAPVEMPWLDRVRGLIECYLGGQAMGGAIADILFGVANPCGKLAETFPVRLSHNPSYLNFPGEGDRVEYREGLFVGYRYYDAKGIEPLFPFGYGLSYTTFAYVSMTVDKTSLRDDDTLHVTVTVKNTGSRTGKEIIQLYVRDVVSSVIRPEKELKGFAKVELAPGEEKSVTLVLDKRAFAYWDVARQDWMVESGEFDILVGPSSRDIALAQRVYVESTARRRKSYTRNSLVGDVLADPDAAPVFREVFEAFTTRSGMADMLRDAPEFAEALFRYTPLRGLVAFSQGAFSDEQLEGLLERLNGSGAE
ncbi:glycoside hydrolase family 3 C-terminal domain-containing protein [Alicyclobacillus cellulosilyticus]|uniref:glycoside hydrolase family 3 C-terminal domain-containing protein n=1 Tax=Alicyclobacillus cellulosilyticus TaxID=1003997 RepID=UPI001E625D72|nr:glycoside hydrolase family 3 C-terminal domain-containing protein [Alicyclobacillus cellulosilyticus]